MENNQRNKEGRREGYWELHWSNRRISSKGYYINNIKVGYWEFYDYRNNDEIVFKEFYLY